jgi:hypothetical protein
LGHEPKIDIPAGYWNQKCLPQPSTDGLPGSIFEAVVSNV